VREGDLGELEALLAADVSLTGDGGGKVPSLTRTIRGRSRVTKMIRNWLRFRERAGGSIREVHINGEPGAMLLDTDGRLFGVWSLDIVGTEIISISSIVNPEKLAHIGSVADVAALLDTARKRD
jgi:RNA polymerase sigma-70 factor (ECF subfamily)